MAEEQVTPPAEGGQEPPAPLSAEAQGTLSALKSFGVEGVEELMGGGTPPAETPPASQPPVGTPPAETPPVETPPAGQPPATPPAEEPPVETPPVGAPPAEGGQEPPEGQQNVIKNPIFGDQGLELGGGEPPAEQPQLQIENIDQVNAFVKENFGVDTLGALKPKLDTFEQMSTDLGDAQKELKVAQDIFQSMPPDLYRAVQQANQGLDWKTELTSRSVFDFNKSADEQDSKSLVDSYFPGQITQDDWEEYKDENGDPNVKRVVETTINSAKTKYTTDKEGLAARHQQMIDSQAENQRALEASVTATVGSLSTEFDGIDQQYVSDVEAQLKGNGIYQLFYDESGRLRPDAARKFVMAKDGYALMGEYKQAAQRRALSTARQEVLASAPATPPAGGGGGTGGGNQIRPEVQKLADSMEQGFNQKSTYDE